MPQSMVYVPGHDKSYDSFKREMFKHVPQKTAPVQGVGSTTLKELFGKLGGYAKAHPGTSLLTGLNAAENVSGLLDNDKILGQVAGAALGYFAPSIAGKALGTKLVMSPLSRANLTMIGGNLGALFDNLRVKQEREQAYAQYQ